MDTKGLKDRSTLRSYFLKNKIPTEANFADLVNSTLNQVEDGIFKPAGDPLSIAATGGAQKLINFYGNVNDPNPSWTLQMNPPDSINPATARAGFSVSDGQGKSHLFIDKASGNIGIGTLTPLAILHLHKYAFGTIGPSLRLTNAGGQGSTGAGGSIDFDGYNNASQHPGARIQSSDDGACSSHLLFLTKETGCENEAPVERLRITSNGNVGIGTREPQATLHLRKYAYGTIGPSLRLTNGDGDGTAGAGGSIDFDGYGTGTNDPTARIQSSDDGLCSSHLLFLTKEAGSANKDKPPVERLRITSNGSVGIGTQNPLALLHLRKDVSAALGPSLRLTNGAGSARAGASIDFDGYNNLTPYPTARIQSSDDGAYSSHLLFLTRDTGPENHDKPPVERLRITSDGNVEVKAKLTLQGTRLYPKVKVYRNNVIVNGGMDKPGEQEIRFGSEFAEVYDCFVMLQGYSLADVWTGGHWPDINAIPQVVSVKVESFTKDKAVVSGYCSESKKEYEKDNRVMFTLVVIGC